MSRPALGLVLALLSGCPVPEPVEDAGALPDGGPCPRALVFGTESEAREFVALGDGQEVRIIAGPQGGWHVWVSVQASALPKVGTVSYVLRVGSMVVSNPLQLELSQALLAPITCGWERRSDALTFRGAGEPYRDGPGQLEVTLDSFTSAPPIIIKRSVLLK